MVTQSIYSTIRVYIGLDFLLLIFFQVLYYGGHQGVVYFHTRPGVVGKKKSRCAYMVEVSGVYVVLVVGEAK